MPSAVAGIQRRGVQPPAAGQRLPGADDERRRRSPPTSAATGLSTRPATAVPARPAIGKARNPAVQVRQVRVTDDRDGWDADMVRRSWRLVVPTGVRWSEVMRGRSRRPGRVAASCVERCAGARAG